MQHNRIYWRTRTALLTVAAISLAGSALAEDGNFRAHPALSPATVLAENQYQLKKLVTNAATSDPNLVNPWGLSRSSTSPWWVSDNGTGLSTLYNATGGIVPLVVAIPPSNPSASSTGTPTGTVFNGTSDFAITPGKPAVFLFVSEDGLISGWNGGPSAIKLVNQKDSSVFKGAAIATVNDHFLGNHNYLYVADFRQGKVDVFNTKFKRVPLIEELFADREIREGYAPFNIQNIGGNLYVAYAKQDSLKHDEMDGAGRGFVNVYSPEGELIQQLDSGTFLNAPWGLAQAPSDFGPYSHDILVANFGSGKIAAFDPVTGEFKDFLRNAKGTAISIDGLWAISFGNGATAGPLNTLYFTAGTNHESGGLFGTLTALQTPLGNGE